VNPEKLIAIVLLVAVMLDAGLQVDRVHLRAALRNYSLMGRALLANFVVVPLLGFWVARLFGLETFVAVGFLLMAIAPGVPFLVRAGGRSIGGSLGFAASLAFIMPALSILTIPITARLVFPHGVDAPHMSAARLVLTLATFQLLPLVVGMLLAGRMPALPAKLHRPLVLVFAVCVVALLVLITPKLAAGVAAVYGSRGMLATLTLVLLSIGVGWVLGGPASAYRRTLSIATALRNIGTALAIATSAFPRTAVAAVVLAYFLIQFVVSLFFRFAYARSAKASPDPGV
jgi:bile acid:Na+ symporter, BASS family